MGTMGQIPDPQDLMGAEVPARTAGELTLPNGAIVWVQTLNTLLRQDCERKANRVASLECADLAPGGEWRRALVAGVKAKTADEQANILAMNALRDGTMANAVDEKYPVIPEPERKEGEDDAGWMERFGAWESAVKERETARAAYEEELWEAERKKALGLTAKERVERCVRAQVSEEWLQAFIRSIRVEQLFRAVRQSDEHDERHFRRVEEVENLDDASLSALFEFYDGLQPPVDAIPT